MLLLAVCAILFLLGFGLMRSRTARQKPLVLGAAVLGFALLVILSAIMAAETMTGKAAEAVGAGAAALLVGAFAGLALALARRRTKDNAS